MLRVRNPRASLPTARARTADPPPEATDGPPKGKPRDPYFDNAKYLAIVLVAMGHVWAPLMPDSRAATALYMFVYAFHMPAFIMLAGYFSRSFTGKPAQIGRLISGVLVPYLIFVVGYTLFDRWVNNTDKPLFEPFSLLDPYYLTWFLIALFCWRLSAPLWRALRWPLPVSLAVAAIATVSPDLGNDFNIMRVLQFLPFFVLGMLLRREHFTWLVRRETRIAAAVIGPVALLFAYWVAPRMDYHWFYRSHSAQGLGFTWDYGVIMSLALFGCGLVLTGCFLAFVPGRHMWFTALGAGSIYGYLLHGFLIKGSRWWGWYDLDWVNTPAGYVAITLIGVAFVTLLCTTPVQKLFRWVVEPPLGWAFKKDDPASTATAPAAKVPAGT
ncbi:acyltransferase family protein [Streptomyces carpaticus]|uniref:acyltransferase family protein n=1 Tax=Streptomyces TaxID=1883 RepID=UPI001FF77D57|nr:acyltransferase family protein [Streptomyces sp. XM4011]MCK1813798.1 acyltransferase family protein [Streptomyces sp. XM4011]UWM49169.1 acyltransferase family protein [Streptomyces carpaticus]